VIEPQHRTIKEGSNISVECQVTGSPAPRVHWSKVRSELAQNQRVSNCHYPYMQCWIKTLEALVHSEK